MKATILAILGASDGAWAKVWAVFAVIGGGLSYMLGGWDSGTSALLVMIGIDFVLGIIVASQNKSTKTKSGGLSSNAMFLGLVKKACEILVIWIMVIIEPVIGVNFLRDAAVTAYLATELLSILENMSLLGVPGLDLIKKVLDLLQSKKDNATSGGESK